MKDELSGFMDGVEFKADPPASFEEFSRFISENKPLMPRVAWVEFDKDYVTCHPAGKLVPIAPASKGR